MDQSSEAQKHEHIWYVFKEQQEVVRLDRQDEKERDHGNRLGDEVTKVMAVQCVVRMGRRVDFGFPSKPTVAIRTEKLPNQTSMLKNCSCYCVENTQWKRSSKNPAKG